jgi:excisionase family DNA binding protein
VFRCVSVGLDGRTLAGNRPRRTETAERLRIVSARIVSYVRGMTNAAPASTSEHAASLLRTTEVAAMLGMSREQVWRLWSAGRLPGYKLDRHLRFSPKDVDQFLQQRYSGEAECAISIHGFSADRMTHPQQSTKYVRI